MSRTMYNCPNCAAPIGYHEVCPYCGTALDWVPFVRTTLKVEKRNLRKCVAVFMTGVNDWTPEGFANETLKQQLGQAASEVWERVTEENRASFPVDGIPPHTARHTATVYFAVKEGQECRPCIYVTDERNAGKANSAEIPAN